MVSSKEKNTKIKENKKFILEMKGIVKRFGGIKALDNVDFNIKKGEVVGLLGDNGAGKSTLIKIVCGVHQPDEGEIFLEGKEIKFLNPQHRRELGIETVYQDLALFGLLDITSNLFAGREKSNKFKFLRMKEMNKIATECLKKTGIAIRSVKQSVNGLSGGQKHAVAIARAVFLTTRQKILLLDEPTAGLGVEESSKLLSLVKNLRKVGKSIVIITHDLDHAFEVADRFVVLRGGKKVGERFVNKTNSAELIDMMVGEKKLNNNSYKL